MMIIASIVTAIIGFSVYHFQEKSTNLKPSTLQYPPYAPQRLCFLGHILHFLKPVAVQEIFRRWSLQVGPVFTVQLGSKHWVVLNSAQAVKDLIVDKSTIYSSRDLPSVLVNDLMNGVDKGGGFAFYPYGPQWRRLRRIAHSGLVKRKISDYQPILNERRSTLLSNIWQSQQLAGHNTLQLTEFIEHYTMTSILAIAFGPICNLQPGNARLHQAFALTERSAAIFGATEQLAEFFPVLKYVLPSREAEYADVRDKMVDFYGGLLTQFRHIMMQGDQVEDCFIKDVIAGGELTDLQIMNLITVFVGAGSETTASTLEWMIALLANHPEVQDKIYKEIQDNVGLDQLPCAEDETRLPYLQCVIHETLRLRSPAPLSVPHATSEDDVYHGWFIPKNTTVIINLHAIHQDPDRYPQPHIFNPDRHMSYVIAQCQQEQRFSQTVQDRPHLAFSTGRRVCVGIHLAERSIFMAASALLACFRFERESTDLIDVDTPKDIRSPTFAPSPYKVKAVARHDAVSNLF